MREYLSYLNIENEGIKKRVLPEDYVRQKTRQLVEFGYSSLTEQEVEDALLKALNGEDRTIIEMLVKDDIDFEAMKKEQI